MNGILVLEDGYYFRGELFALDEACEGEVVFNTSATGYQEILSDPSYVGQIVVLTTSHVGNYGANAEDVESASTRVAGLVVRDYHPVPSNWRADQSLHAYLAEAKVPGLTGVDTRALVLHIRQQGTLRGLIRKLPENAADIPRAGRIADFESCAPDNPWKPAPVRVPSLAALVEQARQVPAMAGLDLASRVSCSSPVFFGDASAQRHVVAIDFGVKRNILRQLIESDCRVTLVPAATNSAAILDLRPDGLLLSNGPGDPAAVSYAVDTIRELLGQVPIFGICLGHQLLARACGGDTYKMPFGHRGANHPVRDLETGRIEITSQNHGFAVQSSSLDGRQVAVTHVNLNDDTIEGIRHRRFPAFSVQFHPEASPGPHDSHHLFLRFKDMMGRTR